MRTITIAAAAAMLFHLQTAAYGQAQNASLEDLSRTSTAIVLGKTQQSRSFWNDDRSQILTEITLRVEQTLKGGTVTETVITVPGGRVGNAMYEVSDMPVFAEGEEVLVFLWDHPSGIRLVTGGTQGKLEIMDDPITGEKRLQNLPRTRDEAQLLGKSGSVLTAEEPARGTPLDDVLLQIRSYVND